MKLQQSFLPDGRVQTTIHFVHPVGEADSESVTGSRVRWAMACTPNLIQLHASRGRPVPYVRSDDPRAVTCPGCMQSAEWKETRARIRERAGTPPEPAPDGDQTKG